MFKRVDFPLFYFLLANKYKPQELKTTNHPLETIIQLFKSIITSNPPFDSDVLHKEFRYSEKAFPFQLLIDEQNCRPPIH